MRGLCACMIVFFHFNSTVYSHFQLVPLFNNAFVFVDFFFVLSGFVITASYEEKLLKGMPLKDYIYLRFGRIYPLHFFMLLLFIALEAMKIVMRAETPAFSGDYSLAHLLQSFLLIQSLGFFDHSSWNPPSWSISVEFYTYIAYAFILYVFKRKLWMAVLPVLVLSPIFFLLIDKQNISITDDYGLIRCFYGFSVGILAHKIFCLFQKQTIPFVQIHEGLIFIATILFVSLLGATQLSFLAPPLFGVFVIIFAFEQGFVSRVLKCKLFLILGSLSYSIYLTHQFIQNVFYNGAKVLQRFWEPIIFNTLTVKDTGQPLLALERWQGDIIQLVGFVSVILFSIMTYKFLESPANRWVRRMVQKKERTNVPEASSAAF